VSTNAVHAVDLRTCTTVALISVQTGGWYRAGPVTNDKETTGGFAEALGCVIDEATRSLVMCDYGANRIVRVRQVDG
jgi:hypothetical protein